MERGLGVATAGAAGLAAVLAGVNLYVSGRRELDKWTREALEGAVVPVRQGRTRFLEAARSALRLSDTAAIGHHHRDIGWHDFRSNTQAPAEQAVVEQLQAPPADDRP